MDKNDILHKLKKLKAQQQAVDAKWKESANIDMLKFFVEIIPRALNVERCSIFIADPKLDSVWLQCGTNVPERSINVPRDNSLVGDVVSSGKLLIAEDLEERMGAHYEVSMKTGFQPRDTLIVPIIGLATKKVTGAIQVLNKRTSKREDVYEKDDIELLKKMAMHIQMSIENIFIRQELSKLSYAMSQQIKKLEGHLKAS